MSDYAPPVVSSGLADVIASGTVISFNRSWVSIVFGEPDTRLTAIFHFQDDPSKPEQRMVVEPSSTRQITLTLINFTEVTGAGNKEPIKLGMIGGQTLYCNFRVYAHQGSEKTLHYTFYVWDPVRAAKIQKDAMREMLASDEPPDR